MEDYEENIVKAGDEREENRAEKERLEEERDRLLLETRSLTDDIEKVRLEIESLEKRENNIPSSFISLSKDFTFLSTI